MKTFLVSAICFLIYFQPLMAQMTPDVRFVAPEYWRADSAHSKSIIGRMVKLKNWGGIFEDLNTNQSFKWPSDEIRLKSGKNGWGSFMPKTGDTGIVVSVFYKEDEGVRNKFVYLLKIRDNYVPVGSFDITDLDKPDDDHMLEWEKLKNADYAKGGCKFKLSEVNGNYSGAGIGKIDSLSESFACDLFSNGHDTVMLCKGYPRVIYAFVLWKDSGSGKIVVFKRDKSGKIAQREPQLIALDSILRYFFENKLDTITQAFKPKLQAMMPDVGGLDIQVATQDKFFRGEMPGMLFNAFKKEPEPIWWKMVSDSLVNFIEK